MTATEIGVAGKGHARVVTADAHNLAAIGTDGGHDGSLLDLNRGSESTR